MKISIIGTLFNQKENAKKCLSIWLKQKDCSDYEIIILDDNSTDGSEEMIKELQAQYPNKIKYYYFERPELRSCTLLLNYGAKIAQGEVVVIQWFDRIPSSFYILRDIEREFSSKKETKLFVTGVAKHIGTLSSGTFLNPPVITKLLDSVSWEEDPSTLKDISNLNDGNKPENAIESALFAMYKSDFIYLGGYDERYVKVYGWSNLDFFLRCKNAGFKFIWLEHQCYHIPHKRLAQPYTPEYQSELLNEKEQNFTVNKDKQWGKQQPIRRSIK